MANRLVKSTLTACGLDCGSCPWHQGKMPQICPGCEEVDGRPFCGSCATYDCVKTKKIEHCGLCDEFPCEDFMSRFDPNNPEGKRDSVYRAGILAYRTQKGDDKTSLLLKSTGKSH